MPFWKRGFAGLDIQPHRVSLLILKKEKGNVSKVSLACRFSSLNLMSEEDTCKHLIQSVVEESRAKGMPVAISLSNEMVFKKRVKWMKGMSVREQKKAARYHVAQHFSDALETVCFDFNVFATAEDYDVASIVAVKRKLIEERIEWVEQADLRVKIVDIEENALIRALPPTMERVCLIECDIKETKLWIYDHQGVHFYQTSETTSSAIQSLLTGSLQSVQQVKKIRVLGEASLCLKAVKWVEGLVLIPIEFIHEFSINSNETISREYAVALGLAMRGY